MSDLLEKVGFKKKTHVGISLSANNFIELVCVDRVTRSVIRYASGNIKYNSAIREIIDFDEFTEVVEGLFDEAGLNPQECCVTLNLPNAHFGITTIDTSTDTPYIIENLQGELEDLYIFKRNEPAISYSYLEPKTNNSTNQKIAFAALQTKAIGQIIEIFDSLQIELVRIDNSYSAILKAIQYCDRFNKYVQPGEKTTILLITPNSCCTFSMDGNKIVDYAEEPLAVKSFSIEEVYATVSKIASGAIEKYSPQSLLIISETDEVNPETLSGQLKFEGEIDFVNKSVSNPNESFIDITGVGSEIDANMVSYLTIEAVGAAVADYDEFPLNINFMPPERISANQIEVGHYEVDMYRFIALILFIALLLSSLLGFTLKALLQSRINSVQTENQKKEEQIQVFVRRTNENVENSKKNIFPALKKIVDDNNNIVTAYGLLSTEIPEGVYIKKFVTNSDGGIGILGEAKTSDLVEAFATRLREKNGDLMVSKLSVNSSADVAPGAMAKGFTFEIKTQKTDVSLIEDEDLIKANLEGSMSSPDYNGVYNQIPSNNMVPPPPVI